MTMTPAPAKLPESPDAPPEERFWQRYSPHHEFPLSSVGSVLIYVLVAVIVWAVLKLSAIFSAQVPLEVGAVAVVGMPGDPGLPGAPGAPGDGGEPTTPESVETSQATPEEMKNVDLPPLNELPKVAIEPDRLAPEVIVEEAMLAQASKGLQDLSRLSKESQQALVAGLRTPKSSKTGTGPGTNGQNGENGQGGTGADTRVKRMARWSLTFKPEEYHRHLVALGAIIGIPSENPNQFWIIRDLRNPVPQLEDVREIKLMRWCDNRPESVMVLAQALKLPSVPTQVWAFFPEEIEQQMKIAEHKWRNLAEDQILETRFIVAPRGNRLVPVVTDQRPMSR